MYFFKKKFKEQKTTTMFKQFSQMSKADVLIAVNGSMLGLKPEDVENRIKQYGKNVFLHRRFV